MITVTITITEIPSGIDLKIASEPDESDNPKPAERIVYLMLQNKINKLCTSLTLEDKLDSNDPQRAT